ncbi:MAG: hypothetical protein LBH01_02165 [Verrucomicrobiales bacterium]|jgi:hypothetical protein|nr:hypothetical protein [Verrucomicrobiales bacterium]
MQNFTIPAADLHDAANGISSARLCHHARCFVTIRRHNGETSLSQSVMSKAVSYTVPAAKPATSLGAVLAASRRAVENCEARVSLGELKAVLAKIGRKNLVRVAVAEKHLLLSVPGKTGDHQVAVDAFPQYEQDPVPAFTGKAVAFDTATIEKYRTAATFAAGENRPGLHCVWLHPQDKFRASSHLVACDGVRLYLSDISPALPLEKPLPLPLEPFLKSKAMSAASWIFRVQKCTEKHRRKYVHLKIDSGRWTYRDLISPLNPPPWDSVFPKIKQAAACKLGPGDTARLLNAIGALPVKDSKDEGGAVCLELDGKLTVGNKADSKSPVIDRISTGILATGKAVIKFNRQRLVEALRLGFSSLAVYPDGKPLHLVGPGTQFLLMPLAFPDQKQAAAA